ncbi:MAG TPA: dethiobiotin synthase [Alphaproteobacteria bacterium]|nr:dethiobiotin synthase [Alphaproteobacteria bacterium]
MNQQRFFVTATGTGVGKSFITAALVRQAMGMGRSVAAYKPVVTGFNAANVNDSDTGTLLRSMELPATPQNIERISPWRFEMPLAPSMAAQIELRFIDFDALLMHSRGALSAPEDVALIEGVGGVMAPLTEDHTILDWMDALQTQTLLVTGSYLGTLSHTLTALSVLQQRKMPVHAIIVNESEDSSVALQDTVNELGRWTRLPIVPVKRRKSDDDWGDVKELRALLA